MASAATFKDQGNDEFKKENFLKAAALYTKAIKEDPDNAVLYSNRSAALLKLNKVSKAMEDAEACIRLKPSWEKGYFRKAAALEVLERLQEALDVYQVAAKMTEGGAAASKELSNKIRTLTKLHKIKISHKEDTLEAVLLLAAAGGSSCAVASRLSTFCKEMAAVAADEVVEGGSEFAPSLHFLPGVDAPPIEERETHIQAASAFASPEHYTDFVGSMREVAAKLEAAAAIAVVPKAAIAYPQVWQRKGWPSACGSPKQQGVFVQLELRVAATGFSQHAWFVPVWADKSTGKPVSVNVEDFGPLPTLFK